MYINARNQTTASFPSVKTKCMNAKFYHNAKRIQLKVADFDLVFSFHLLSLCRGVSRFRDLGGSKPLFNYYHLFDFTVVKTVFIILYAFREILFEREE